MEINNDNTIINSDNNYLFTKSSQIVSELKPRDKDFEIYDLNNISLFSDKDFSNKLNNLYIKLKDIWLTPLEDIAESKNKINELMSLSLRNFNINENDDNDNVIKKSQFGISEIMKLRIFLTEGGNIEGDTEDFNDKEAILSNVNKMYECSTYCSRLISNSIMALKCSDIFYDNSANDDETIDKVKILTLEHNQAIQDKTKIKLYILSELFKLEYRRVKNLINSNNCDIYKPIYHNGINTYSYQFHSTMEDFLYDILSREKNENIFDKLSNNYNVHISNIAKYLSCTQDSYFCDVNRDRHIFSFNNGIYITNYYDEENEKYTDLFLDYVKDKLRIKDLLNNKSSSNFLNRDFEHYEDEDWMNIPTPNFDKIIKVQYEKLHDYIDVYKFLIVMLGRLFYNVGELDNWQVFPYIKGQAGTGKGSLLKILTLFYSPGDIGTLSNNIESLFGIYPLINKFIWAGFEIKGDFSLEQATFQSMISGESVSYAIKNKGSRVMINWLIPMILAGNVFPDWVDNSGSLQRRTMLFKFDKKVNPKEVDTNLYIKLEEEAPLILQKLIKGYLHYVNKYKHISLWEIAPKTIKEGRISIAERTNNLYKFMSEIGIEYNNDYYITITDFRLTYNKFCKELDIKPLELNNDTFLSVFYDFQDFNNVEINVYNNISDNYFADFELVNGTSENNVLITTPFITGFNIKNNFLDESNIKYIKNLRIKE